MNLNAIEWVSSYLHLKRGGRLWSTKEIFRIDAKAMIIETLLDTWWISKKVIKVLSQSHLQRHSKTIRQSTRAHTSCSSSKVLGQKYWVHVPSTNVGDVSTKGTGPNFMARCPRSARLPSKIIYAYVRTYVRMMTSFFFKNKKWKKNLTKSKTPERDI